LSDGVKVVMERMEAGHGCRAWWGVAWRRRRGPAFVVVS
jgi:hypothetical protein